ncbi:MAG: hypothetical protein P9L88_07755 [Candidatus Tantalella remota]|nr:hypothetical protein [Candidatus Tantalella remota]
MQILVFLIVFPLAAAAVLLPRKSDKWRSAVVRVSSLVIGLGAITLLFTTFHKEIQYFPVASFL